MEYINMIIIGFIAGLVSKLFIRAPGFSGFIMTTILGIAGSLVSTFIGQMTGFYSMYQGSGIIGSIVGAVIFLAIYGFIRRNTRVIS